jgi:hypothetical protein
MDSADDINGESRYTSSGWVEGMLSGVKETVAQVRTVVLSRPLKGMTSNHYTFDPSQPALRFVEAVGTTASFQYHGKSRGGGSLVLVEQGAPVRFVSSTFKCWAKTFFFCFCFSAPLNFLPFVLTFRLADSFFFLPSSSSFFSSFFF